MRLNGEAREILMRVRFTESNVHTLRGGGIAADRSITRTSPSRPSQRLAEHGRARRGQDAGSALLRDEAVHTALLGPRGCT